MQHTPSNKGNKKQDKLGDKLGDKMGDKLGDKLGDKIGDKLRDKLGDELRQGETRPREGRHTIQHQGGHLKKALRTPNSTLFGEIEEKLRVK